MYILIERMSSNSMRIQHQRINIKYIFIYCITQ